MRATRTTKAGLWAAFALLVGCAAALAGGCGLVIHYDDYAAAAGGGSSTASVTSSATGTGSGGPCMQATDCPGTDSECAQRTCVMSVCGVSFGMAGTLAGQQVAGDCKKNACDGAGAITAQDDATDVPPDEGNDCTVETCAGGVPTHSPKPVSTPCGAGMVLACDAAGKCQGCTMASQCGSDTECSTWACDANQCSQTSKDDGALCGGATKCAGGLQQNHFVCKTGVCSDGGTTPCAPFNCDAAGMACLGFCVFDSECQAGYYCGSNLCVPTKALGVPCTVPGECASTYCDDGVCCDKACSTFGPCQRCIASAKEGKTEDGTCGDATYGIVCGADPVCSDQQHIAQQLCAPGGTCTGFSPPTGDCGLYACLQGACLMSCATDAQCGIGAHCANGAGCCASCSLYAKGTATYNQLCMAAALGANNVKACGCQGGCQNVCNAICSGDSALLTPNCAGCLAQACGNQFNACFSSN